MGLSDQERARLERKFMQREIGPYPTGPVLQGFDALTLAQAIERELTECKQEGHTKLSLHMDLVDAQALASALRKLALLR